MEDSNNIESVFNVNGQTIENEIQESCISCILSFFINIIQKILKLTH